MEYKLTIWHKMENEEFANSMCDILYSSNIPNVTIEWIRSRFYRAKNFDFRRIYLDIFTPTKVIAEDICLDIFERWPDDFLYIKLESQYPCSWKKDFEKREAIRMSGKYVEIKRDKSVSRSMPYSDKIILMANPNLPFNGGILIEAPYSDESYSIIEENLTRIGFKDHSIHNVQRKCYKVDFTTNVIRGALLYNNGWYCDELGTWRSKEFNAKIVYPNDCGFDNCDLQRNSKWYEDEREWKIRHIEQNKFYDYSDDDLSLNPAFW